MSKGQSVVDRLRTIASFAASSDNPDIKALATTISQISDVADGLAQYLPLEQLELLSEKLESSIMSNDVRSSAEAVNSLKELLRARSWTSEAAAVNKLIRVFSGLSLIIVSLFMMIASLTPLEFEVSPIILGISIAGVAIYQRLESSVLLAAAAAGGVTIALVSTGGLTVTMALAMSLAANLAALALDVYMRTH